MPKEFSRTRRINEQLRRELNDLLRQRIKDPRASKASVTEVAVARDLSHAKVFVSSLDLEAGPGPAVEALNAAAGLLRHDLGRVLHLRTIPELHFVSDEALERGARLSALIDRVRADDEDKARGR